MSDSIVVNVISPETTNINVNDTGENIYINPLTLNQGIINHSITHQSGGSDELVHNLLGGLQGGSTGQYYHISSGQYYNLVTFDSLTGDRGSITITGNSPSSLVFTLDNNAVTSAKIQDFAITSQKLATLSVTNEKLAIGSVSTGNIALNAVLNSRLADVPPNTIKGRISAGTGDPQDLTSDQVKTILNFDASVSGLLAGYVTGEVVRPSETGVFYTKDNPSGFITGVDLSAYVTGDVVRPSQTGNFITTAQTGEFYATNNPSGFITGVDLSAYVTGDVVRPSETGVFVTTDQTGQFYPIENPSGFITGVDLSEYITGEVVRPSETGIFYTTDNPSGFITGVDLSAYVTGDVVRPTQTGDFITTPQTGAFYSSSNPSGFITGVDLSAYVSGDVVRPSETGDFITTGQTGQFYSTSNPSGFITGVDLSAYVTGDVVRPTETGNFITTSQTGEFYPFYNPSGYIATGDADLRFVNITGNETISGEKTFVDNIDFKSGIGITGVVTFNREQPAQLLDGQAAWHPDYGTVQIGMNGGEVVNPVGFKNFYRVKAADIIRKGKVVMAAGSVGNSEYILAREAQGIGPSGELIMGISAEEISTNNFGDVIAFGAVRGVNTSSFPEGSVLYYDPTSTGELTNQIPQAPNAKVIVAFVTSQGNNGVVFTRVTAGSQLGQTDSNVLFSGVADGDAIFYDGVSGVWRNRPITSSDVSGVVPYSGAVTGVDLGSQSLSAGAVTSLGDITASGNISGDNLSYDPTTDTNLFGGDVTVVGEFNAPNIVKSSDGSVTDTLILTQSGYDAIAVKSSSTIYYIVG